MHKKNDKETKSIDVDFLKTELQTLLCAQKELIKKNNSIAINLTDPINKVILTTDYDKDYDIDEETI